MASANIGPPGEGDPGEEALGMRRVHEPVDGRHDDQGRRADLAEV
jgi:hypothetical protein